MITVGTTSLVADYPFVYENDPALAKDTDGFVEIFKEYMEDLDGTRLPLKPGQDPTLWRLRHIRGRAKRGLQDLIQTNLRTSTYAEAINLSVAYTACQLALVSVENARTLEGKEFSVDVEYDREVGMNVVTEECMTRLNEIDEGGLVNQLGIRAIMSLSPSPN